MGKKQTGCRKQRLNHLGQQMIWQLQETRALQVELSSSILPIAWRYRTIFAWFTSSWMHSLMVTSYHFGGGLLTKEVYAYSDRISCMYVCIYREREIAVYIGPIAWNFLTTDWGALCNNEATMVLPHSALIPRGPSPAFFDLCCQGWEGMIFVDMLFMSFLCCAR